jgi:Proteasome maturation factor UMP1
MILELSLPSRRQEAPMLHFTFSKQQNASILSLMFTKIQFLILLCRVQRLPGIPSSRLGLDSLTGNLDDFSFGSYLNLPENSEVAPPDMHTVMEKKF